MRSLSVGATGTLLLLCLGAAPAASLWAHGIVGHRMFIEPLVTEDANVKNELDLPGAEFLVEPDGTWRTIGFSFEKALYPRRLSFILEDGRIYRHENGRSLAGWDNLDLGLKWEAYENPRHEFVLSPALLLTAPTGSTDVTEHETALQPMILYGKGFGDLTPGWLRPFAIAGDFGYRATVTGPRDRELIYDTVLMYSMPYLNRWVRNADAGYSLEGNLREGFSRGAFFGNLYPFVEFNGTTPVQGAAGETSTYLRPGISWMGKYVQVSLAADVPLQGSGLGLHRHAGAFILVDWFLDEIFPRINWTPFGHHHHPDEH
jgi:hypothetical protein